MSAGAPGAGVDDAVDEAEQGQILLGGDQIIDGETLLSNQATTPKLQYKKGEKQIRTPPQRRNANARNRGRHPSHGVGRLFAPARIASCSALAMEEMPPSVA